MCDEHDVKTAGNEAAPEDFWTPGAFGEVENAEPPHSGSRALALCAVLILSVMFWCAVCITLVVLNN